MEAATGRSGIRTQPVRPAVAGKAVIPGSLNRKLVECGPVEGKDEKRPPIGKPVADTVHCVVNSPWPAVRDGGEMDDLNSAKAWD